MERWQPHVEEARRQGVSLKAYAAEHGLSLYSLYRASQVLRQGGAAEPTGSPDGKFAAVRVVAAPTPPVLVRVAAQLPNGVSLHVDARGSDVAAVIAALGALSCSA
jgi:transposase-like protein